MKSKKFLNSNFTFAIIIASFACKVSVGQTPSNNSASSSSIIVDGSASDWQSQILSVNKDTKLAYAVSNDKDGINILIKSGDRMQQMKIMNGGMQILVDTKGKKDKSTGITYPMAGKNERPAMEQNAQRPTAGEARQQPDIKKMRAQMLAKKNELEAFGFTEENNGISDINFSPVKVAISWDDKDTMIYEAKIPYSIFANAPSPNSKISIGIVLKGMKFREMGNRGDRGDIPPGGDMGGPGGPPPGAPGGPPGGGSNSDEMQKMFEENSFWIKYTLTP